MQERSDFRDRVRPSYVRFREQRRKLWKQRLKSLMQSGHPRMPAERALDVCSNLLYGTIFTNHFRRRHINLRQQADDVLAVVLHGLMTRE